MAVAKTFTFEYGHGEFNTRTEIVSMDGTDFNITFVEIAPKIEQAVRTQPTRKDFEGAIVINRDDS
jgi:hypothetical protein